MTTPGGVIQSLSASQAEEFDPEQVGGCPRRWYYHRVERAPLPERENSKVDGDAGHALFAMHYRGEALPKRARMLKAVEGAFATGRLPAREPGQLVESRFDGQAAKNGERLPLRTSSTLWLGGVPWDGCVDLRFYRCGMITVLDHKFSSDIHTYGKTDLLSTVQMPVYALDSLRIWPEAQHVELVHNYVSRRGVDSLYVRQLVTATQVRQRARAIEGLVQRMQAAALAKSADAVSANKKSCHTWSGCPFQSRCSAFKEKPKMNLNPEEMEWLNVVSGGAEVAKEKPNPDLDAFVAKVKAGGPVGEPAPLPEFLKEKLVSSGPEADRATELEIASAAGALDPSEEDPFAVFAPQASVPQEQPATPAVETAKPADGAKCPDCPHPAHPAAACTGKRGRGACRCGIGRTADGLLVEQAPPAVHPNGPDAGHPMLVSHLPVCVQDDAGKWLCMEGCPSQEHGAQHLNPPGTDLKNDPTRLALCRLMDRLGFDSAASLHDPAVTIDDLSNMIFAGVREEESRSVKGTEDCVSADLVRERDMHRRTLGELDASERGLKAARAELERLRGTPVQPNPETPPTGWTGALRVEVNLGPETLALLQRLLGAKS